jgi:biotin synthase
MGTGPLGALESPANTHEFSRADIIRFLESEGEEKDRLFALADQTRETCVGKDVHLRGIIEFSNYCARNCLYCGLRKDNSALERFRMTPKEIVETGRQGKEAGVKTIVLQSGEDPFFTGEDLARLIDRLKEEFDVAVTVSVGDRKKSDYRLMREAGADRYLLKHETADAGLFASLRPGTTLEGRRERLLWLKELGFQVGSGNIVGLPGQTIETIADDILFMSSLDVEMAGIGPFIPNDRTPLARFPAGTVDLTLKTVAVARLLLPFAHLPATSALAAIDPRGRRKALRCGANVIMPNITPMRYGKLYEIYPNKIRATEEGGIECITDIFRMISATGRSIARDYGHSRKPVPAKKQEGPKITTEEEKQ